MGSVNANVVDSSDLKDRIESKHLKALLWPDLAETSRARCPIVFRNRPDIFHALARLVSLSRASARLSSHWIRRRQPIGPARKRKGRFTGSSGQRQVELRKHVLQVKTGLPGMACVRLDSKAEWPAHLRINPAPWASAIQRMPCPP
jgi:hypothetical protein